MRRILFTLIIAAGLVAGYHAILQQHTTLLQTTRVYQTAVVAASYPAAVAADLYDASQRHSLKLTALATGKLRVVSWHDWTGPTIATRYSRLQARSGHMARVRQWTTYLLLIVALLVLWRLWRPLLRLSRHMAGGLRLSRSSGSAGWAGWYVWWRLYARRREVPFSIGRIGPFGIGPRLSIREKDQARNAILWGPPGYGKTRLIVENILRLSKRHKRSGRLPSLTFTDSKGSIYAQTAGWLTTLGYRVVRIDWLDPTSDGYNPLDPAHIQEPADAFAWAASLIENTGRNSDTPYWDDTTTLLLIATLWHLMEEHGTATLRGVQKFLGQPAETIKSTLRRSNSDQAREAAKGMLTFMEKNDRLEGSVFSGPPLKFMALWDSRIVESTSRNAVAWRDLADPALPPVAVFVTLTPGYERMLRPFVGALFDQMNVELLREANSAGGARKTLRRRVMNWWDEIGTIGKIADLPSRMNTTREAGIGTVIGAQSTTQLDEIYTEPGRKIILQGCYAHLVLPGLRAEQAEAVAVELGQATVAQRQGGATRDGGEILIRQGNVGLSEKGRPLLTADEVRRLWAPQLLAIVGNLRPVKLWWGGRWYWNLVLRRRGAMKPPVSIPAKPALPALPANGPTSELLIDWQVLDG